MAAHHFDCCLGWQPTVERIHTFSFSMPLTPPQQGYFFFKKGNTFDISDFTDKKIGNGGLI
jgi:hypothetical protein